MTTNRALNPRQWVGLSLAALALVAAFVTLGLWQYSRAYRVTDGYTAEPIAVGLDALDPPDGPPPPAPDLGRLASVSGSFDATRQEIVVGRRLDGEAVDWVLTPLRLADGSAILVVRGWSGTGTATAVTVPPSGPVDLTGRLEGADPGLVPPALPYPLRAGYLVRTAQSPPDPLSLQPVPVGGAQVPGGVRQFHLLNAVYAVQWWTFAVLVVVFWIRLLREELRALDRGARRHQEVTA